MSPKCAISGKWRFVTDMGAFSISLAHTGTIPKRDAARGNTPIPSNRLPNVSKCRPSFRVAFSAFFLLCYNRFTVYGVIANHAESVLVVLAIIRG
jgi:hypothetical protein